MILWVYACVNCLYSSSCAMCTYVCICMCMYMNVYLYVTYCICRNVCLSLLICVFCLFLQVRGFLYCFVDLEAFCHHKEAGTTHSRRKTVSPGDPVLGISMSADNRLYALVEVGVMLFTNVMLFYFFIYDCLFQVWLLQEASNMVTLDGISYGLLAGPFVTTRRRGPPTPGGRPMWDIGKVPTLIK